MLATLIPLFDENMSVKAYSLFSQKNNYFLQPSYTSTGLLDGAGRINGLEIIDSMGIETLSTDKEIFVPINNIAIFSDISEQCKAPHERIVLLIDNSVIPNDMYINRMKELKSQGYRFAIRKLPVASFEDYRQVLLLCDYIFLNHQKIDITKAQIYFTKIYPNIKLIAGNIKTTEEFEQLKANGGYTFYEGEFYRTPVTQGETDVSPLKINYIQLLNIVNEENFDLTDAADVIGRDTALVISLLKIVNRMSINSEITSIRHATAMLGQRELKKWTTTAVTKQLCLDKPNEVTRLSLLRAKFAENLAPVLSMAIKSQELFLMGLFSVLDIILDKPMDEALDMVIVSKDIRKALVDHSGPLASAYNFILQYENANWQEVSRLMLVDNIDMDRVYNAYCDALKWYRKIFSE
ncbi:MAG: HDOD domain-containing protein [Lachnospiraceae bacterium]|nr:HDOD domain-containing protein [Lachnospiraceae bacterium]